MAYATGQAAGETPLVVLLELINDWSLRRMTAMNREILAGRSPRSALRHDLGRNVLAHLPAPEALTPRQAQQLVVILGLAGASVGRHYQEAAEVNRATPEQAFAGLTIGVGSETFLEYFVRLAERTEVGHGQRDSYASLVRWNLPQAEVYWAGQRMATLPSVFEDGLVRSYTGVADECRFFGLLKASEVLEKAVNQQLIPLSDGSVDLGEEAALLRIAQATLLLDALRELNTQFAALPPAEGMSVAYFLDGFRQYAVHWRRLDIPPSGAQDPEAMCRDLILGIAAPSDPGYVRRLFPSLLDVEREMLETLLNRASLPEIALRRVGLDATALGKCSKAELQKLIDRDPVLAGLHLLLNAHARVAGVHLRLSKRFLFAPQRVRDREGMGDSGVVSNRSGTTGMDEARLEALTKARHEHILSPLHHLLAHPHPQPQSMSVHPRSGDIGLAALDQIEVRFIGSDLAPQDLGLPALAESRALERPVRS